MPKVKFTFTGQFRQYKWREGEVIEMDEQTLSYMNPMAYSIRLEQPRRNTMDVPKAGQPVKREIKQNGSWFTLYVDGVKVKSARKKEDLL